MIYQAYARRSVRGVMGFEVRKRRLGEVEADDRIEAKYQAEIQYADLIGPDEAVTVEARR